jgi:hypothetical protein
VNAGKDQLDSYSASKNQTPQKVQTHQQQEVERMTEQVQSQLTLN